MDEQAIRQTVEDAVRHQTDADEFVALHTEDAIIVNLAGRRVYGREALRQALTTALATPLARVLTTTEVEDIRFVGPDIAIVSSVKHVSDERDDSGGFPEKGSFTYVMVKEPDRWRIALAQTTPILTP